MKIASKFDSSRTKQIAQQFVLSFSLLYETLKMTLAWVHGWSKGRAIIP
jgi:hypothetical protein